MRRRGDPASDKAFKTGSVLLPILFCIARATARAAGGLRLKSAPVSSQHLSRVQPAAALHVVAARQNQQWPPQTLLRVEWKGGKLRLEANGASLSEIVNLILASGEKEGAKKPSYKRHRIPSGRMPAGNSNNEADIDSP